MHSLIEMQLDGEGKIKSLVDKWEGKELTHRMTVSPPRTSFLFQSQLCSGLVVLSEISLVCTRLSNGCTPE